MSAPAPAAPAAADAAPATGGKKKLIIMVVAGLLLLGAGVGAGMFLGKKKAPAEGEEGADGHGETHAEQPAHDAPKVTRDPKHPPVFVPLDPFTVNLADRDADRYAQVSVTLELADAKVEAELKTYMPAIRSNILLLLSSRKAEHLITREGKEKLAQSILYASVRPLGYLIDEDEEEEPAAEGEEPPKKKKKKKKLPLPNNLPVVGVHFSNIIVQ
ncbi:MAG: hypothetical protein RLY78_678 [Pseudomonadota bacterium]|jgi:flagellar FliL protein